MKEKELHKQTATEKKKYGKEGKNQQSFLHENIFIKSSIEISTNRTINRGDGEEVRQTKIKMIVYKLEYRGGRGQKSSNLTIQCKYESYLFVKRKKTHLEKKKKTIKYGKIYDDRIILKFMNASYR